MLRSAPVYRLSIPETSCTAVDLPYSGVPNSSRSLRPVALQRICFSQESLDSQGEWLRQRFLAHRGNADVVRQVLEREKGIKVSLRTVERAAQRGLGHGAV